jgi:adhesin transport system membrane fusion protein
MARKKQGRWNDADFALDVDAAYIQGVTPRSKMLLFLIVLFFAVAIGWANYAMLDEVTHAEGKVIPSSQVQIIQNLEGGIIKEISIKDGDMVEIDEIMMRIDDTGLSSSYGELETKKASLRVEIERLNSEADGKPLTFSPDLMAEHQLIVLDQRNLFQARQDELQSQLNILRQQVDQRKQEKVELQAKLKQSRRTLSLAQEELKIKTPLAKKGIVPKVEFLAIKREVNDLRGQVEASQLALPRADASIAEANRRIEEKLHNFKSLALRELTMKRGELDVIEESLRGAKDKVVRTDVRSPIRGVVKAVHKTTVGGVVKPGEDLIEIVPLDDTLLVEARIRPADIAFLRPDQQAMVKLTAYDFSIYGGLPGQLEQISADTIRDEQGEEFYKILVRTDKNHLVRGTETLPIMPGMVASVDVLTGRKTVMNYLLKPIFKAQQRALTER